MGRHSRRPAEPAPTDETVDRPVDPPVDEPVDELRLGLRRRSDGRVTLDAVADERAEASASPPVEVPVVAPDQRPPSSPPDEPDTSTVGEALVDGQGSDAVAESDSRRRHPTRRPLVGAGRFGRVRRGALDEVGGPIQPAPTIYFGRPPGTENRRAGAAASLGALLLLLSAFVPWANRSPASIGAPHLGWRDADGSLGPGALVFVLGVVAVGLALAALAGRHDRFLQVADAVVGGSAVVLGLVEWRRIGRAADRVAELTDGAGELSVGWGVALSVAGGAALILAAVVHRSTPPAWRQG